MSANDAAGSSSLPEEPESDIGYLLIAKSALLQQAASATVPRRKAGSGTAWKGGPARKRDERRAGGRRAYDGDAHYAAA